ncbi:hypothetical protein [Frigidibacter oleivorans]|uniref:hypothetical protein n=1 Tax=Frigidibacter oleivorans TaxID=2487129 RepID=UPI000F8DD1AE|nr:hypothetical protein [Frigidibacter oleivorans]
MTTDSHTDWCPYHELPGFTELLLEESYVLEISCRPEGVCIRVELALLMGHPKYSPPAADERHCYKMGEIRFAAPREVCLSVKRWAVFFDASEEADLGNIDAFVWLNERHFLEGDWGKLDLRSSAPSISLT